MNTLNLTEVVVRPEDTLDTLREKVHAAAVLGTYQSTLTDFRYLRKVWKKNTEEERLLGVSLTGIMDHPVLGAAYSKDLPKWLEELRSVAVDTNKQYAAELGINVSAAVTCVKPSGTVSQLVDTSSGIHPRYSEYYIRTVRQDIKDPMTQFLIDQGVPAEQDVMNPSNVVFSFPIKSPDTAQLSGEVTAREQLDLWAVYQKHWCEHKPSMTCYYRDDEFLQVGQWVWDNFDMISGISFLPYSDHVYKQAPYQPCTEEQYNEAVAAMPEINWDALAEYDTEDTTSGSQELACVAGACEL